MEIFVGCQTNSAGFWSDCCRGQVTPSLYFLVKQLLRCCWKNKLWPHWAWTTWDGVSLWDVVVAMLFKCCLEFSINHQPCLMLHSGNHTCRYHPFTLTVPHKDTELTSGFIQMSNICSSKFSSSSWSSEVLVSLQHFYHKGIISALMWAVVWIIDFQCSNLQT